MLEMEMVVVHVFVMLTHFTKMHFSMLLGVTVSDIPLNTLKASHFASEKNRIQNIGLNSYGFNFQANDEEKSFSLGAWVTVNVE